MSIEAPEFDFGFLGFGASACADVLAHPKTYQSQRILLLDPGLTDNEDRFLCGFDLDHRLGDVLNSWQGWTLQCRGERVRTSKTPYSCTSLQQLREAALKWLREFSDVEIITEPATSWEKQAAHWRVSANQNSWSVQKIIDARGFRGVTVPEPYLKQHFYGEEFQFLEGHGVGEPVLMDLYPDSRGLKFFYLLPLASDRLFIEVTFFSPQRLELVEYQSELNIYRECHFPRGVSTGLTEKGEIPLVQFDMSNSTNLFPESYRSLGVRDGALRASTGYSLQNSLSPDAARQSPLNGIIRWMDRQFLEVLFHHPEANYEIFSRIVKKVPDKHFRRFLGKSPSCLSLIWMIIAAPKWIFLKQLFLNSSLNVRVRFRE